MLLFMARLASHVCSVALPSHVIHTSQNFLHKCVCW